MSFSNSGVDTFDERKSYIGVRLQQGVPLLDRDWNELEDVRRHLERMLRRHYIGEGVPDLDGFAVRAPSFAAPNDVVIAGGRCSVAGFDVWSLEADVLFSEQGDGVPLPPTGDDGDALTLYLEPDVVRVDSTDDPGLANAQDVRMETCVRDQLRWAVRAVAQPAVPPAGSYVLAEINRPPRTTEITNVMITDRRRLLLNLAQAVDRIDRAEARLTAIATAMARAELDIENLKQDLGRLFWDVEVDSTRSASLFGGTATLRVTVHNRLGAPIQGAQLSLTTDWGVLTPAFASTDAEGRATIDLVGVPTDAPLRLPDVGVLDRVSQKVEAAVLPTPGAVEYARLRFEPDELSVLSRYSPPGHLADLGTDLPVGPIVAPPTRRTATVTVHAREGQGAVVRGVGSIQVTFGLWIRDFLRTKIADVARTVEVGARIGDILRQGIGVGTLAFDASHVANELLPTTLQAINDDTHVVIKRLVFADPEVADQHVTGTGLLTQVIAQEATAAVGGRTNQAISHQLRVFAETPEVPVDEKVAAAARTQIVQRSSQITAGFAQYQRQQFSGALLGQ